MQTETKKTPDRFQNYFCPAAANDIVHHAYAWIVKEPNMQPKFLYCRAIDDPANDRGWNIIAEVWERDVLGGWGISSSTLHPDFAKQGNGEIAGPDNFPGHEFDDYKNPDKVSVSVIPVQLYWKDDPSEPVEAKFSIEDTCNLAIDEQITFSGYTENELVDMIGREDNGEDFVITGVGPRSLILTEKKDPDHGKRLSDKQAKVKTASDRLDAEREPKANIPIHDEESK